MLIWTPPRLCALLLDCDQSESRVSPVAEGRAERPVCHQWHQCHRWFSIDPYEAYK